MEDNYKITGSLQCIVCGGEDFTFNDDKSYIKCSSCNREYLGGYDELLDLNTENINNAVEDKADEIAKDLMNHILKGLK